MTLLSLPKKALRAAAADALEWLRWLQAADVVADFGRRKGLDVGVVAQNDAMLLQAIQALELALKEER